MEKKNTAFISMAYSEAINSAKPGQVNPSYDGGYQTKWGTYFPIEFKKFQNLANNSSNNKVWHVDSGYDAVSLCRKGDLLFDLQSTISGAIFHVSMNIDSQKIVKVVAEYNDFKVCLSDKIGFSTDDVVALLSVKLVDILDKMIDCCTDNGVKEKLKSFKVSFKASYIDNNQQLFNNIVYEGWENEAINLHDQSK